MSKRLRIPAGEQVMCCNHIQKNGHNPMVFAYDLTKPGPMRRAFERVKAVPETEAAKYIILCPTCHHAEDKVEGAPWHKIVLAREVIIGPA